MRIAISDPSSSLLIPTSLIASANASGHPPAWANDSTSASVTPSLESSALTLSSAVSQSTLTSAVRTCRDLKWWDKAAFRFRVAFRFAT
ncbi:hypothetical protein B0H14DRAFT_3463967 [Mycena olivaceomarginata]|nr:hypothetical protein B0H14DRAFT_3463967 [Mycena olivaceomarginata]